jgi:hypothetical protein
MLIMAKRKAENDSQTGGITPNEIPSDPKEQKRGKCQNFRTP